MLSMKLKELKGTYDAVFSLGNLCLGAMQLEKNKLRPYSGVLDWMSSPHLPDVSRLLRYRFTGFMDLDNLRIAGMSSPSMLLVMEEAYGIMSNHDFAADKNTLSDLTDYPTVKAKFDRRIQRFLDKAASAKKILYIRTEGEQDEVSELQAVLSKLVKHDFRLLHVVHSDDTAGLVELDWPLDKVCAVKLPNNEIWSGNDHLWKMIFDGIRLSV